MSSKSPWEPENRKRFLARLELLGWTHLGQDGHGADLYQMLNVRLAVDDHGVFIFCQDSNGRWRRRFGLADSQVDEMVRHNHDALRPLHGPDGSVWQLDLETADLRQLPGDSAHANKPDGWNLQQEMRYLYQIGLHAPGCQTPHREMLKRYLQAYTEHPRPEPWAEKAAQYAEKLLLAT